MNKKQNKKKIKQCKAEQKNKQNKNKIQIKTAIRGITMNSRRCNILESESIIVDTQRDGERTGGKKLHLCSDPDRDRHAQACVKGKQDRPQERTSKLERVWWIVSE